jgi:hypothetical protein
MNEDDARREVDNLLAAILNDGEILSVPKAKPQPLSRTISKERIASGKSAEDLTAGKIREFSQEMEKLLEKYEIKTAAIAVLMNEVVTDSNATGDVVECRAVVHLKGSPGGVHQAIGVLVDEFNERHGQGGI